MSRLLQHEAASRPIPRHLDPDEVYRLMAAAQDLGRHGHRDATMILLAYRHGLSVSELVEMRRAQVDLRQRRLHVHRHRSGLHSIHTLTDLELKSLGRLLNDYPDTAYVFVSERHSPMTCANVRRLVARAGESAGLGMAIHPYMLRHSTGFTLANEGKATRAIQRFLGHRNIQHSAIYTRTQIDLIAMRAGRDGKAGASTELES